GPVEVRLGPVRHDQRAPGLKLHRRVVAHKQLRAVEKRRRSRPLPAIQRRGDLVEYQPVQRPALAQHDVDELHLNRVAPLRAELRGWSVRRAFEPVEPGPEHVGDSRRSEDDLHARRLTRSTAGDLGCYLVHVDGTERSDDDEFVLLQYQREWVDELIVNSVCPVCRSASVAPPGPMGLSKEERELAIAEQRELAAQLEGHDTRWLAKTEDQIANLEKRLVADGKCDRYGCYGWLVAKKKNFTVVAEKSRQIGFTWGTACGAVIVASLPRNQGGLDVYYMSTGQDDARDFINECMRWIIEKFSPLLERCPEVEEFDWIDDDDPVAIQTFRIRFPSGFAIYALPSRPARMRGKKRCLAILDEAAQNDLDAWIKATGALKFWGGQRAIISTHYGSDSAFYKYVQRVKASIADGKRMASLHSVFLHDALRQGVYRR